MRLLSAILVVSGCCLVNGLTMTGVSLSNDRKYVKLQDTEPTILECQYKLKEGKTANNVTWYHDNQFIFTWMASEPYKLGASLTEKDIATGRNDGHLEILKLHLTFAGNYRCEVTTSAGETFKSYEYQLLVVDLPNVPITTNVEVSGCNVLVSMNAPAISPRPRPICGAYVSENQYILTVGHWLAFPHKNGSVAYSVRNAELEINQMPQDAIIKCEIGITKIDGSYIQLMAKSYNVTQIWERGCPPLNIEETQTISYENMTYTCRNEIIPMKGFSVAKAHIKCKAPLISKYNDLVNEIMLECKGRKWDVAGEMNWNHHDNLICVKPAAIMMKQKPKPSLPTIKPPIPVRGHHTNSGTSLSSSLTVCVILILILSLGVALKFNFKKPRRYVE